MNEEPIWSVGLVIDDAESRTLSENSVALYMMEATEGHVLRFASPPMAEAGEIENLRLEVAAGSAQAAEERALGVVYRARRAAGLPDKVVPVAWVAPQGELESGENYLDQAEELFEEEKYGLAIVSAEIHLESQAKTMIEMAVKRDAPSLEEVLLQHRNNTKLRHPAGRKMIQRFLGLKLTQLPEWEEFESHLGRRNEVAHGGKEFGEAEASKSIGVVRKIWLQLAEAARRAEEVGSRPEDSG
jgi:hypothetical protein